MIDMIEARVIATQMVENLLGKKIAGAVLMERKEGSMRDRYLIPVNPEEFQACLEGRTLTDAYAKYRHVCIETDGEWGLDIWDVYGKILFIEKGAKVPGNPPIVLHFTDGTHLIVLPGVWAAMSLRSNAELRAFRDSSDPDIVDASSGEFSVEALKGLFGREQFSKSTIKEVMTRYFSPAIMSVMGALCQEALYRAKIHPKHKVRALTEEEFVALHSAIQKVTCEAIAAGGRASERDLFDRPGGFLATVSKDTEGKPCPVCGTAIEGIKLGGAGKFYICPGCQVLKKNG